jgi:hypothetical protein
MKTLPPIDVRIHEPVKIPNSLSDEEMISKNLKKFHK